MKQSDASEALAPGVFEASQLDLQISDYPTLRERQARSYSAIARRLRELSFQSHLLKEICNQRLEFPRRELHEIGARIER